MPPFKPKPGKRKFRKKRKVCQFCQQKFVPDFKDAMLLRQFISDRGKIHPPRNTGTCAKHQRALSSAIKRARNIGLVSYTAKYA